MSDNEFGLPINGGNAFNNEETLKAIESNLKIFNGFLKGYAKKFGRVLPTSWQILNYELDYWINLIDYDFKNQQLNNIVSQTLRSGFLYGISGCWNSAGKLPVGLHIFNIQLNEFDYPKYLKAITVAKSISKQVTPDMLTNPLEFKDDEINQIILFNPYGNMEGWITKWMFFINQLEYILKMCFSSSFSYLKKFVFNIRNTSSVDSDLDLFFNPNNPFIINQGSGDLLTTNKFSEVNFGRNEVNAFTYLNEMLHYWYSMIGRRFNADFKSMERNVTSEVDATQSNFDILQREVRRNILTYLKEIETIFNVKGVKDEQLQDNSFRMTNKSY